MSVQTTNGDNNDIFTNGHTENNSNSKIASANSIDSLDNCSTVSSGDPSNQVRTLFVSGLPMDTKPRELYLLFRAYSGYESSLLKVTNKNGKPSAPVGFVTFTTHHDANEARRKLQGVRFDPELSQTIRLELAKSNTKVSKPKQPSPPVAFPSGLSGGVVTPNSAHQFLPLHHSAHEQAGLLAAAAAANNSVFDQIQAFNDQQQLGVLLQGLPLLHGGNQFLQQHQSNAALAAMAQLQQQHQQQQQQIFAANGMLNFLGNQNPAAAAAVAAAAQAAAAAQQQQQSNNSHSSGGANPPCSTLFVANLGSNPQEEEIRQLFKKFPGFCRLRLNNKSGSPVAFIEFSDVRQAAYAQAHLQGTQLASSERGNGIRIEYARTKMGEGIPSVPIL
jgi:RNA recognition motif-containing protein